MVVIWKTHMPKLCNHQPGSPEHALKQPDRPDADKRSRFMLVVGAGLSFVLIIGMTVLDKALKTPEAPAGWRAGHGVPLAWIRSKTWR
jgi:hypothetical protein